MAEDGATTPGSVAQSSTPARPSASKDRMCPYCKTSFTSSSLGRHLDLYIKEKNPKPPDGVHDVDQIRRSRGNITRRQARASSTKREDSSSSATKPVSLLDRQSPSISQRYINGGPRDRPIVKTRLNAPNWESTGVINDLPYTFQEEKLDNRKDAQRRTHNRADHVRNKQLSEERDRGIAAELALKELLDSIKVAKAQMQPSTPFDFEFFTQTFPSLCLRCLTAPTTNSSSQLISGPTSWVTSLPRLAQRESLRQRITFQIGYWRKNRLVAPNAVGVNGTAAGSNRHNIDGNEIDEDVVPYHIYLDSVYQHWTQLPDMEQKEHWHLECLQALAREQQEHGLTHAKLERAQQDAANLRIQLDRLNKCQQPREYILFPPKQLSISRDVAKSVSENGMSDELDHEVLIGKWKSRVQVNRNTQKPLPQPPQLSTPSDSNHPNHLYDTRLLNDEDVGHEACSDDDLMDAPGDEDEELVGHGRAPTAQMERGMLDPKLREHDGEESMQGVNIEGGGFGGGRLLAELRNYAGVNGRA